MAWNDDLLLKVANIASYALFTSGNVYAQLQGTVVSETYLTPSRWIFGVWPFIHFLFLGMIIYQFTEAGSAHVVRGIGWRFPLLCILNAAYSGLSSAQMNAHHDRVYAIVAFVVMLLIAATVSHCYRSLKVHHTASNLADTAVVHLPFSLYHGFVVVLLFVSGFEAFGVNANTHKAGIITKIVVFLSLLFLESTAAGYVWYSEGDVAGAAVISLSLLAIFRITAVLENLIKTNVPNRTAEISSFQSLCAHLWRSVTRARKLDAAKTTTFRMAVNCRHRLNPRMEPYYFGNAIQSIPTVAPVGEVLSNDLRWCADLLHKNVVAHDDATVRRGIADWESQPRLFPLGNFDGASITMGSSPRFPMYDNDFGWGRPIAVRSGRANKFDGKISAFPGREGNGSVDLEVVLSPETMAGLERDTDFMQYVSTTV